MHYAWLILVGCCMVQGGTLGTILNCSGVYYVAVCRELGFPVAQLALYRTFAGVVSMLSMPLVNKLFNRYDTRIILTAAAIFFIGPTMLMSQFQNVSQWHLAGMVQGLGSNLLTIVAPPVILSNWFKEKTGLAIGISSSFAGLMGATCNSIVSWVVVNYGWRTGYFVNGCIAFGLVLPATLFILRFKPANMGMKAYKEKESEAPEKAEAPEESGYTDGEIKKRAVMIMILTVGVSLGSGFIHMLNAYGISIGMAAGAAALLASVSMIGNTIFKLLMGVMVDKLGTRGPALMCYLLALTGCLSLIVLRPPLIFISAILFGFVAVSYTTLSSLITKAALGTKGFHSFYPKVSMVMAMLSAVMGAVHGWIFDTTGAYVWSLILSGGGMAVSAAITIFLFYRTKKA